MIEEAALSRARGRGLNAHIPSKIVSLNIRSGGGTRAARLCEFLDGHEPDVVVLSEWRERNSGPFVEWAQRKKMSCFGIAGGSTTNGILVASRAPFQHKAMTPAKDNTGAFLLAKFEGWTLLAAYFPQMRAKSPYFAACSDIANAHADTLS